MRSVVSRQPWHRWTLRARRFRHEMPEGGELADQNIKDRFHGENDPVARKIFRITEERMTLKPPEDRSITTLYIGGLTAETTESQIQGKSRRSAAREPERGRGRQRNRSGMRYGKLGTPNGSSRFCSLRSAGPVRRFYIYGTLLTIKMIPAKACAFITFSCDWLISSRAPRCFRKATCPSRL